MNICSFGKRINSVKEIEMFGQLKKDTVNQSRFTIKNNEMILQTVEKCKFVQINDKKYCFEDGIISLPFYHPYLNEINEYKTNKKEKIENWILKEKNKLLKMEKKALLKNHRLSTLQSIFYQMPEFRDMETNKRCKNDAENKNSTMNTRNYILHGFFRWWVKI